MESCLWCNSSSDDLKQAQLTDKKGGTEDFHVCGDECETNIRRFNEYVQSHVVHFLFGIIVLPLLGLIPLLFHFYGLSLFLVFSLLGAVMIKYPFATPQTVTLLGAKKSISLIKTGGIFSMVAAVVMLIFVKNG